MGHEFIDMAGSHHEKLAMDFEKVIYHHRVMAPTSGLRPDVCIALRPGSEAQ